MALSMQIAGGAEPRAAAPKPATKIPAALNTALHTPAPTASRPQPTTYTPPVPVYTAPSYTAPAATASTATVAAPTNVPTQANFIANDATFQNQQASLVKALQDYVANQNAEKSQYNVDYNNSQTALGYNPTTQQWNMTDANTASGKANQDQQNDFAGRGLLQSSLYANAKNDLLRSLGDQETSLQTAKQNYMTNLANQLTAYQNQNTVSQQQAKADALSRYAAQYAGLSS